MTRATVFAALRTVLAVTLLAGGMVSLSACNTTRGAGEDVSSVGHDASRAASHVQQGIANATGGSAR